MNTLGIVLTTCVGPANIDDRDGAVVLLSQACDAFGRFRHVRADQGHRGKQFCDWTGQTAGVTVQIVSRRDGGLRRTWATTEAPPRQIPRFAVVSRRWVIERTFAWPGKYRRPSKDYEYPTATSEHVIYLAMSMILLHRLTGQPPDPFSDIL